MWIKEEWEDLSINLDNLTQEMVIGPSNQLAKAVKNLNRRYITSTYVSGNRSLLQPIKPLGFTRTYRWSPGYKDIIKEVIVDRMLQYNKTGTLETMFNRAANMNWSKENFERGVLNIEEQLRLLRGRNATTDSDLEIAKTALESAINKFKEKDKEAEMIFGLKDNLEYDFTFQYETFHRVSEDPLTAAQLDMLKFLTGSICLDLKYKNAQIPVINANRSKHYGVLETNKDLYLSLKIPFYKLFQALQTRSFDELDTSIFNSSHYVYEREIDSYLISMGLSTNRSHYRCRQESVGHYNIDDGLRHPFIGNSLQYTKQLFGEEEGVVMMNVCFGNMQEDINNALLRLDFVDLLANLDQWQTYCVESTNPLNNISYSILTLPEDRWDNSIFLDSGSIQVKVIQENLLQMNGINSTHRPGPYASDNSWSGQSISNAIFINGTEQDHIDLLTDSSRYTYGWQFTEKNWLASIDQVRDVCDPDLDRDEVEVKHITMLQNYLFDSIQSTVDMLDADKCITRDHGHYNDLVKVLQDVLGEDCGYELYNVTSEKLDTSDDSDTIVPDLPSFDGNHDDTSEPFSYEVETDLPFGEDETITVQTAEEIMTAMEQQLMERG